MFKQFSDNESFRRWLCDPVFTLTYDTAPGGAALAARYRDKVTAERTLTSTDEDDIHDLLNHS